MKHLLLTTIAAVLLVGCGESQQSAPPTESKPVEPVAEVPAQPSSPPPEAKPVEPVAEASQPEPPTTKAPDISIHDAIDEGNIEAVKQHLAAGADVNAKARDATTPLHLAALKGQKEIAELLIAEGANVNAKGTGDRTPLNTAIIFGRKETAEIRIKSLNEGKRIGIPGIILQILDIDSRNLVVKQLFQNSGSRAQNPR